MKSLNTSIFAFLICFISIFLFFNLKIFPLDKNELEKEYSRLFAQAEKFRTEGEFEKSLELFEASSGIAKRIPDEKKECESLLKMGLLYWNIAKREESAEKYKQALSLAQKLNLKDKQEECQNALEIYRLYREGNEFLSSGEYQKSIESFEKAIDLAERTGSKEHKTRCMRQLSLTYWVLNKFKEFHFLNEEALNISKELKHRKEIGRCLNNIGLFFWKLNSYSKALTYFKDAIKIAEQEEDKQNEAECLNNIGLIHQEMGSYEKALEYLFKSLSISQKLGLQVLISINLNTLGETYRRMGLISRNEEDFDKAEKNFNKALDYFKDSLKLAKDTKQRKTEIQVLNNIGSVYSEQKKYQDALQYFKEGLKKAEEAQDFELMGFILTNMGIVSYNQENYEESTKYYEQAINLAVGRDQVLWEAYMESAKAYEKQNEFEKALVNYQNSIEAIEKIRSSIDLEEFKAKYLGTDKRIDAYHNLINLLISLHNSEPEKGYDSEAFNYLERAKARAFLDSIELSRVDISQGVDLELLNREKELMKDYSILQTKLLNAEINPDEKDNIFVKLREKDDELETLKQEIRAKSPAYANLKYPEIITLKDAQEMLPDKNTAFFAYCLGKENCYAFVITKKELEVFPLPSRDEIKKQVIDYLGVLNNKENQDYRSGYNLFSTLVLPGLSKNLKTIIFIPDDILNFFPFETLITNKENRNWLVKDYRISYAPSISSLREIIQRKKLNRKKPPCEVLAFGDPYFGSEKTESNGNEAIKEFYSNDTINLFRLRYSRFELDEISSLFKKTKTKIFRRENASEEQVKKQNLADYKVIHFATHSIIDDKIPARSSIVLLLDKDPNEDGFLQMREIYNLKLNSDLVTLSSCETGLGELIRGEGIEGLNRAFFYAGSSSVLMSLWAVNDQASSQLMERFYYHLRSSESIMNALRKVKLEMINSSALSHPYYWAGFIVSGKADEIIFSKSISKWLILGIPFLLVSVLILAAFRSFRKKTKVPL